MSTDRESALIQVKEESCPQPSPQPGRCGSSVPAPQGTTGQMCPETQHTKLKELEWALGQHEHDSKCRSTSQVPALAPYLRPPPLNIFPCCEQQTPLVFPWEHPTYHFSFTQFFSFPPFKDAAFVWLELVSRTWMVYKLYAWTHRQLQTWLAAWLC